MVMKRLIFLFCIALLTGCAVQKEQHEHQTHVINADSLVTETQHDGHSLQHRTDIDSLVAQLVQTALQEYQKTEQEHEVTTETLTETIDSLGRVVRQQQKVTDRTISRQELQRQEQQIRDLRISLQRHIEVQDSAWADRFASFETHLRDSLDQVIDQKYAQNAAPILSWWQRLCQSIKFIMLGAMIAVAVYYGRKLTRNICL